jgi:uncharacterized protein YggE
MFTGTVSIVHSQHGQAQQGARRCDSPARRGLGRVGVGGASLVMVLALLAGAGMTLPRGAEGGESSARAALGAGPGNESAAAKTPEIVVTGTGEVQRAPDFAVVSLGVECREPTAGAAAERAGAVMERVVREVKALGIPGMLVQTTSVTLNPQYEWVQPAGQRFVGFDAVSVVSVRVADPKAISRVIDTGIGAGANRVHGINFELKELLGARQEALTLAAKSAREKAQTLAAALGLKITGVVSASTGSSMAQPKWLGAQSANRAQMAMEGQGGAGGLGEGVEPGMVTVQAEASVVFKAEPM